ncbi:CAP domain-containing protein [Sphingomonas sp. S2-65]|uniref:CAP domain-containing protein n=1 Tax=Sphingomonas sp. S2-65 TaxID=2903960 RepID=UPI001F243D77|nr:CAP domain-containing protein [Sphingomonas sp. S2-65]UYY59167.1 CAP domain-containing protein [Sphingomonas sp. S2-65]
MLTLLLLPVLTALAAAPVPPTLEQAILAELNVVRADPRRYAAALRGYRRYFKGRIVYTPTRPGGIRTAEGVKAVDEAIAFLERQPVTPPLSAAPLLARAAGVHVAEQGPRGDTGHRSRDGADPRDRMQRLGGGNYVAETITYGPDTAAEVVRQLIVDDAVPTRGHRRTVFAAEMRFAGAQCGPHKVYGTMCVVEYGRTETGRY